MPKEIQLRKRAQFLAVKARGDKLVAPGFVMQYASRDVLPADLQAQLLEDHFAVGFTATKRLGNAVLRNRVKRRLRAMVREVFPAQAQPGYAYVIIGRWRAADMDFNDMTRQARGVLSRAHSWETSLKSDAQHRVHTTH